MESPNLSIMPIERKQKPNSIPPIKPTSRSSPSANNTMTFNSKLKSLAITPPSISDAIASHKSLTDAYSRNQKYSPPPRMKSRGRILDPLTVHPTPITMSQSLPLELKTNMCEVKRPYLKPLFTRREKLAKAAEARLLQSKLDNYQ
ncbi:hypothetical protein BC833DRAFT_594366 [Globomyces pollinis-pini]|nr:hypothetical protein BC833DRAFT_594366 [Globomyces pollinis-pini]